MNGQPGMRATGSVSLISRKHVTCCALDTESSRFASLFFCKARAPNREARSEFSEGSCSSSLPLHLRDGSSSLVYIGMLNSCPVSVQLIIIEARTASEGLSKS